MILYLFEKVKKLRKLLFMNGIFLVVLGSIVAISIQNPYPLIFTGVGFILWVPYYFFLAREYKEEFGEYDAQLVYYWISSLGSGIFLIILPFIL